MNNSTILNVKRTSLFVALGFSSLMIISCATAPESPDGAEQVRSKLTALKSDPNLADRARAEFREAEAAVRAAEQPVPDSDTALAEHRIYMADRKVAIAEARATTQYAEAQRERIGEQRDEARLEARTQEVSRAREDASQARREAEEYQRQIEELQAEETDRGVVLTLGDVLFETGSADLEGAAGENLNKLVAFLNQYPDRRVQIEGHTDNVGSAEFNQELSRRRAESVKSYLTQQGIASQRLSTSGFGMGQPVESNDTSMGRQRNRRVDIIIENAPGS